jgi:uncharacterized membrane protein YraQ (UPF0718 family)
MARSFGDGGSEIFHNIARIEPSEVTAEGGNTIVLRWAREFCRLAIRLVPEYLVLVLILGGIRAWLFPTALFGSGNSLPWLIGVAVAGTLFAIPTAAEIPIVQAMLQLGVGAGPAGALLITLPAVSLPSLVMLGRAFPAKTLGTVAFATAGAGVFAGLLAITLSL